MCLLQTILRSHPNTSTGRVAWPTFRRALFACHQLNLLLLLDISPFSIIRKMSTTFRVWYATSQLAFNASCDMFRQQMHKCNLDDEAMEIFPENWYRSHVPVSWALPSDIMLPPSQDSISDSSSVMPSDSASQVVGEISDDKSSNLQDIAGFVKRRRLKAISTWDHFRQAQGDEPRTRNGKLLHYCKRCVNPTWSTHISGNARYRLETVHHAVVREQSNSATRRQLAIENAFARTASRQLQRLKEAENNTPRGAINYDAFREA